MPTYVLEGGTSITLPAKPVSIRLQADRGPGPGGGVRLDAVGPDGPVRCITPTPGMLVVPQVDGPVVVRAHPLQAERFGSGTVLDLTVGYESRQDLDPDRGVLNDLDVSGLRHRDIVALEPADGRIRVTVLGPPAAEGPLSPVAALARDAAREILGIDQLPPSEAVTSLVGVDISASMRALHADGTVAQVLDILGGVHRVVGRSGDSMRACLIADRGRWLLPVAAEQLSTQVSEACSDLELTTGFRAAEVVHGPVAQQPTQTWLVTDGAPADIASIQGTSGVHLVCLMPQSAASLRLGQGLPATVVGLPDVVGQPATFGSDGNAVRDIVASLVASFVQGGGRS